jgi:hypothetical protein
VPQSVLLAIFSGLASCLGSTQLDPFIANMHTALWCLAGISALGAGVSLMRPKSTPAERRDRPSRGLAIEEAISEEIEATP